MFNPLTVSKILKIAQTHNEVMAKSLQKKIILDHYANRCFTQKMMRDMCQNHCIISIPLSLRDNESKRGTKAQPEATMILQDQQFSRMLGPWLQPPIHANTRSPSGLASPGPAIEFAVLPCGLCRTGDRCRTPSWWGMRRASSWHAPAIVSCQLSPPSGCSVRRTAQQARGSSFSSTLHAQTHRQRRSGGCVA